MSASSPGAVRPAPSDRGQAPASASAVVTARGVGFRYSGGKTALEDVSFELPARGCVALIGKNGSGKSTLLSLLAGRLRATAGQLRVPPAAYAAQRAELDPELSVQEHLQLFAALEGLTNARATQACNAAVEGFGLAAFATERVARLSGGQRRRLHLALSSLSEAPMWLLK